MGRLTGEIAADLNRQLKAAALTGEVQVDATTFKLSASLTCQLSEDDTLVLTAAYLWAEPSGRQLRMEYRRSF